MDLQDTLKMLSFIFHMPGCGVNVLTDSGFFSPVWNQYVQDWFCFSYLQFTLERQKTAEKERLFLVYAKQWWREYLQIRPTHNARLVKIFAQVCKFYRDQSFLSVVFLFCFELYVYEESVQIYDVVMFRAKYRVLCKKIKFVRTELLFVY